jgi:hypothetical protein
VLPIERRGTAPDRRPGQRPPAVLPACGVRVRARLGELARVVSPCTEDGQPAPALRFGDPRVMALFSCLCAFALLFAGLTNRSLRPLGAGLVPATRACQMTYDLRRLRRKGLIRRLPRKPALRADRRRPAACRLLHEDLLADRLPLARRARPDPAGEIAERTPLARALARIRASARRPYRRGGNHGLKSSLRPSTPAPWAPRPQPTCERSRPEVRTAKPSLYVEDTIPRPCGHV